MKILILKNVVSSNSGWGSKIYWSPVYRSAGLPGGLVDRQTG